MTQSYNQEKYQNNQNRYKFWQNQEQAVYFEKKDDVKYEFYQKSLSKDHYNKEFENYMNISKEIESNNIQNYEPKVLEKTNANLIIFEFFLTCRNCNMMFYFNN